MTTRANRQAMFTQASRLIATGDSVETACARAGLGVATFYKWRKNGVPGESAPSASTGRPPAVVLTAEESAALRKHALGKDSSRLAVEDFLRDPVCQASTAEVLIRCLDRAAETRQPVSFPLSARRILSVTKEERNQFRSRRSTLRSQFVGHRGMFDRDEDGTAFDIHPGDIYESDDMSLNEYFRFTDPDTGEQMIGRQSLMTQDVYSQSFLGGSPIGRARDAYRVEDIADHMLAIVQAWGLPLRWRLERGPWENNFIDGIPLDKLGRPEQRWGSLTDLFNIQRAWNPNQKGGIEGSFRHLQRLLAHNPGSPTIGTFAGEFEQASKHAMRAKKGRENALNKFWEMQSGANALVAGLERFNGELKQRDCLNGRFSPDELFAERPEKRVLKAADAWLFNPVKRIATVRNGCIETTAPHWGCPFRFAINGIAESMFMGTGHQVLISFHPGHPENGCAVFNADMGTRNRSAWRFGQFLLTAPFVPLAPQIDLSRDQPNFKAKADAAMRGEFRAVKAAGQISAPSISSARDGLGSSLHFARGQSASAEMPVPAGRLAAEPAPSRGQAPAKDAHNRLPLEDAADSLASIEL